MLKTTSFKILFFIFFLLSALTTDVFSEDILVRQLFVAEADDNYRYSFMYSASNQITLKTKYKENSSDWLPQTQTEWIYSLDNDLNTKLTKREYLDKKWNTIFEIEYIHNEDDQILSENHYTFDNNQKKAEKEITYSYTNKLITSKKEYYWKNGVKTLLIENTFVYANNFTRTQQTTVYDLTGNYLNQYQSTFTYNSNGFIDSQLFQEKNLVENIWMNVKQIHWYYVSNANLILTQRTKVWNDKTGEWDNKELIEYEYDADQNLISESYQKWEIVYWQNACRYDYSYSNGNVIKKTLLFPIYQQWREVQSVYYSNFVNNKASKIESKHEFWGGNTGELVLSYIPFSFNNDLIIRKGKSIELSYIKIPEPVEPEIEPDTYGIIFYNNPSDLNGLFYISPTKTKIQSWTVYDLNGRLIKKHTHNPESGVIDLSEVSDGIYIINILTDDAQYHKEKLIKRTK